MENYLKNYDFLNNHSDELETRVTDCDEKEFIYPLYQLVSNNSEVKVKKLKNKEIKEHAINSLEEKRKA